MGFCINEEKSVLQPTKRIEYLGNIINSETMTVMLPERRIISLVNSCKQLKNKKKDKIREVAKVIGILVAAIPAVEIGKLHYRKLERTKIAALAKERGNFEKWMEITEEMKADLKWWISHVAGENRKIFRAGTEIEQYTDASNLGWGCYLNHQTANGRWLPEERKLHINALELSHSFFLEII